jgi:hypothetical protein
MVVVKTRFLPRKGILKRDTALRWPRGLVAGRAHPGVAADHA